MLLIMYNQLVILISKIDRGKELLFHLTVPFHCLNRGGKPPIAFKILKGEPCAWIGIFLERLTFN